MYLKQNVKVNAACENCLGQTNELIEKQRRETDFLIISLKTIVYIKGEKTSKQNFAKNKIF